MRLSLAAILARVALLLPAAAMEFTLGGTDHRSDDAAWIQAEECIDERTLEDFIAFLESGPDWYPERIRLNSPGGSLLEGIALGEEPCKQPSRAA